ncbi:D-glycero-D-manno-heptose 1-phosphate guanosyltransferase [Campylobacter sp. MIT 99-7217]|uniref:D-glycero-D-manno-heptose 1-phosphate guanosyltransferase n=1 Tax=Campylobacter sp. MIT 99-7217 TaxID=535091 RepID=UPI00115A2C88|nr:nucleotidyltransferase family protein [Campylobacter sp. MIT 99-7217]TQR33663.1 D-glycero-D-manno-heptose 1-phosphate guanosyltransferase [Campylobacter sp. MIT 99-7217]
MEAILLCGGLGTRLKSVVKDLPKPMANINGKPFLQILLEFLQKQGFKQVILAVAYKFELIQDFFANDFKGMKLIYSIEKSPLGTGGGLRQALSYASQKEVFVLNGDSFFDINLKALSLEGQSKIILALKRMKEFDRYGEVRLTEAGFISSFREKEFVNEGLINAGIYLLKKDIFEGFILNDSFSFEDFLQANFKALKAKGLAFEGYFKDIGVPEDYEEFKRDFKG